MVKWDFATQYDETFKSFTGLGVKSFGGSIYLIIAMKDSPRSTGSRLPVNVERHANEPLLLVTTLNLACHQDPGDVVHNFPPFMAHFSPPSHCKREY